MLLDDFLDKAKKTLSKENYDMLINMVNEDIEYNKNSLGMQADINYILEIYKISYEIVKKFQ